MSIMDFVKDYLIDQDDGMKAFITFFLNMVMQYEAEQQSGAGRYQRTDMRTATRNGYKPRELKTRFGDISLSNRDVGLLPRPLLRTERATFAALRSSTSQPEFRAAICEK